MPTASTLPCKSGRAICTVCGWNVQCEATVYHKCRGTVATNRHGLGDIVAAGLSAVGITKERVQSVTGKPCGCAKRQQQLNEIGRKLGFG